MIHDTIHNLYTTLSFRLWQGPLYYESDHFRWRININIYEVQH